MKHLFLYILLLFCFLGFSQSIELKIKGKDSVETTVINSLNYNTFHNNINAVDSTIIKTQYLLTKLGYIENQILKKEKINDSLYMALISLKTKYETIVINYNKELINTSIIKLFSEEVNEHFFTIPFTKVEFVLELINKQLIDDGQPFSNLRLNNITILDSQTLQADLVTTNETKARTLDNIVVEGYTKFPKAYITRFLNIKTGKIFNINSITNKLETLNNLPFAKQLKAPQVLFTKDSTTVYLYLEKQKSNRFDGVLGFNTNTDNNNLEFNGYLDLNLVNNLNYGESFTLNYKSDENEQRTLNITATLPYLFKTPLGSELNFNLFKKDSAFTNASQSVKLFYQINSKHKVFAGISSKQSNNLLDVADVNIQDYNTTFYTASYEYLNSYNTLLFPVKSYFFSEFGTGNRNQNNTTLNQTQVAITAHHQFNLNAKNAIYVGVNGAGLFSNTYLENELDRFGGIKSIRGFDENSLVANLFGVLNTEYRYTVNNTLYAHTVFDAAYLKNNLSNAEQKLFGFGLGIGLLTKAGLFKFIYANGKAENTPFKFNNSKIHLSLEARF